MIRFRYWCPRIAMVAIGAAALTAIVRQPLGAQAQPPAVAATGAAHGKAIYDAHCVECHGASGRGDGPASPLLTPRPRDFTAGKFEIRTTETGSVPTDEDLARTIRQGMYGTSMPAWQSLLSDADVADVVSYVKTFSPRFTSEQPRAVSVGEPPPGSADSLARGQSIYARLQCASCHGTDGHGKDAIATEFQDDWDQPLDAANLTMPWTFHGGSSARDVFMRFRTGMSGTPMPSFADSAGESEMWDLANYVLSFARKPVWSMDADEVTAFYAQQSADAKADPVKHGKYLVETRGCAICHSPTDDDERILPGMALAGGQLIRIGPFGDYVTMNLTADKDTGLGNWTDDEIKRAVTRGILRNGDRLPPFPMPWPTYAGLTPDDLNALVAYLRTVPPVRNRIPPPSRPFLPIYLWSKFRMLVLQQDLPVAVFPGNAGSTARGGQ